MTFTKCLLGMSMTAALLGVSSPLLAAGSRSNAVLLQMLKQQAAEIQSLKQRLAALEAREKEIATVAKDTQAAQAQQLRQARQTAPQESVIRWGAGGGAAPVFHSSDGSFIFEPIGRLFVDFGTTHGSRYDDRNITGTQISQARLGMQGKFGIFGYKAEVDFGNNKTKLRSVYLSYATRMFGHTSTFYAGNFLKDQGIASGGSASLPFMWKNAADAVTTPSNGTYSTGAQWKVWGANWHYSLSVTGPEPGSATSGARTDSVVYLTRAHWNPIKSDDGFLHLGAWYYYEKLGPGITGITTNLPVALAFNKNAAVVTASIADPTQDHAVGYELGGVYRNFWIVSEYARRTIDSAVAPPASRNGFTLGAGWMITGEKAEFGSRNGTWEAAKVLHPVTSGGWGAFELAVRLDRYDLAGTPGGGNGKAYSLGLNWYLTDWSRLMFDYSRWRIDDKVGKFPGVDWANSLGVRTQVLF